MTFFDDVRDGVNAAVCIYLDGVDNANSWLRDVIPTTPRPPFIGGIRGALCDKPEPAPTSDAGFEGGQCSGVVYRARFFSPITGNPVINQASRGPITAVVVGRLVSETDTTETREYGLSGFNSAGVPEDKIVSFTLNKGFQLDFNGLTREDGLLDDCGDPPPPPPPPFQEPTITVPIPNPDGGPDFDIDVTLSVPVIIGPNVFAPVRITGPTFELSGTVNLSPEFNIQIGGGSTSPDTGVPIPPESADKDSESPDKPQDCGDTPLVALVVDLAFEDNLRATQLEQDGDIGSIGVPRVAILYFEAIVGGRRLLLPGIDLKLRSQVVPTPGNVAVVCWRIHTEPGCTVLNARPVYATAPGQSSD